MYNWIKFVLSFLLFAGGSFLISLGWYIMKKKQWVNERMKELFPESKSKVRKMWRRTIICSIFGASMIAGGGLLSTHTWNAISLESQRQSQKTALITAVVLEWSVNHTLLKNSPIEGHVYYGEKVDINLFPNLITCSSDALLASGLFDFSRSEDSNIFITILNYNRAIKGANRLFLIFNEELLKKSGEGRIKQAEKHQEATKISPWGKNLTTQDQELHKLLITKYFDIFSEQLLKNYPEKESKDAQKPN